MDLQLHSAQAPMGLIAHIGFWILLAYGWMWDEIGLGGASLFLSLWIAGWLGLPYFLDAAALFSSYVAVLDIALVFMIFQGDVKLR
jgi:hypothetical protein